MLRVAAKRIIPQHARVVPIRRQSVQSSLPQPPKFGRNLIGFSLVGSTMIMGTLGYVYISPKFRRSFEHYVPPSRDVFNSLFGPIDDADPADKKRSVLTKANAATSNLDVPEFAPYVLIGGGTASYYAAMTIRARDPDAVVLILTDEDENIYSKTHLSKELWWYGDTDFADTLKYKALSGRTRDVYFEVEGFYVKPSDWSKFPHGCISLLKNAAVEKISVADKSVILKSGQRVRFNKCLIATGSRPKISKELQRSDLSDRVHTFYTIKDFREVNSILKQSKSVAIIGGGFLASELAYSIKRRIPQDDLQIYQIFQEEDVLREALPAQLSEDASRQLFKQGVTLVNKVTIFDVSRTNNNQLRLILRKDDGSKREVIVDHVIDASGSEPNTEVAKKSGLEIDKLNGGVIVDSGMRARSDIFAAGDVSSYLDLNLGRRRIEHAEHAEITGRVAGENMTNGNRAYPRQASFHSAVGSNSHMIGVGRVDPKLKTIIEFDDELRAVTFYVDKNTIVGVLMYNVFGDGILVARKLIEDRISPKNVEDLGRLFRLYPMPEDEQQESGAEPKTSHKH